MTVKNINFIGNKSFSDNELKSKISTKEDAWYKLFGSNKFVPERMEYDKEKLKEFYKSNLSDQLFIAHCNESKKDFLISSVKPKENVTILIGPEGDFSKNEVDEAIKNGFKPVSLGNTRFRAETAAIIATHTVSIANM